MNIFNSTLITPANSITLRTLEGLCNRLAALSSALALGYYSKKQVRFIWISNIELNAHFNSLFEIVNDNLQLISSVNIRGRLLGYLARKIKFLFAKILFDRIYIDVKKTQDFEELLSHSRVYIESWMRFYSTKLDNLSYLRPIKSIQVKIDIAKNELNLNQLIGIHIRRGDSKLSHQHSPTETFVQQMQREVDQDDAVRFFVTSDSEWEKQNLKQIFGERIVTYDSHLSRANVAGMQDAVVELYLLAESKKIIGSLGSSFSSQAAMIKGIPLYRVKDNQVFKFEFRKHRALSKETH